MSKTVKTENKFKFADEGQRILRLNKALIIGYAMYYVFIFIAGFSSFSSGAVGLIPMLVIDALVIVAMVIMFLMVKKSPTSLKAKTFSLFAVLILSFLTGIFYHVNYLTAFTVFPLIGYIIYNDKKFSLKAVLGLAGTTILLFILRATVFHSLTDSFGAELVFVIAMLFLYAATFLCANIYGDFMHDIVGKLDEEKNMQDLMMNDVIQVASEVRQGAHDAMDVMEQLAGSTGEVTDAVRVISGSTLTTAENVQQQNLMTQNIQDAIESTLDAAKNMVQIANETEDLDKKSVEIVRNLRSQAEVISSTNAEVADIMKQLQERAEAVKGIADTIFSISSQTNLLALNASIESARAGEAGRGFAVVADEIRGLAEKTRLETETIDNILSELSSIANQAADTVSRSVETTDTQHQLIENVDENFMKMNNKIEELNGVISNIDNMLNDLKDSNNQIVDSVSELSAATEEVSASSTHAEGLSNSNLENADNTRNLLNNILDVASKLDKYTS